MAAPWSMPTRSKSGPACTKNRHASDCAHVLPPAVKLPEARCSFTSSTARSRTANSSCTHGSDGADVFTRFMRRNQLISASTARAARPRRPRFECEGCLTDTAHLERVSAWFADDSSDRLICAFPLSCYHRIQPGLKGRVILRFADDSQRFGVYHSWASWGGAFCCARIATPYWM